MSRELIEIIEQTTLVELQHDTIIQTEEGGGAVVDGDVGTVVIDQTPDTVAVEQEATVLVLTAGEQGPPGPPGPTGPAGPPGSGGGSAVIEVPAGGALGGHRAVRLSGGAAIYADNREIADANLVLGLTLGAAAAGAPVQVQTAGMVDEPSWSWAPDLPIFLSSDGLLTQALPGSGFALVLGFAVSATRAFIGPKSPIVLE